MIDERLGQISRIIAVSSGKGGVGKSMVATTLALTLAQSSKVGLFDLDFTSPSTHLILGVKNALPKENKGIIPPQDRHRCPLDSNLLREGLRLNNLGGPEDDGPLQNVAQLPDVSRPGIGKECAKS